MRFSPAATGPTYNCLGSGVAAITQDVPGTSTSRRRNDAQAEISINYGLPGYPGYAYTWRFDYFTFQTTASSAKVFENVMTRGLLFGTEHEAGNSTRGVWGLYGRYDCIAPQTYRVSSTALSLGTTAQIWLTQSVALQGTALAGVGYAATGTIRGAAENDYHYGASPQGLMALRRIFGESAALDLTARDCYVTRGRKGSRGGHENITRADVAFAVRVHRQHVIAVKYLWNRRNASSPNLGDRTQSRGTFGIFYTLLGHERFGAADWR